MAQPVRPAGTPQVWFFGGGQIIVPVIPPGWGTRVR